MTNMNSINNLPMGFFGNLDLQISEMQNNLEQQLQQMIRDIRENRESATISDMFDLQMAMNRRTQFNELFSDFRAVPPGLNPINDQNENSATRTVAVMERVIAPSKKEFSLLFAEQLKAAKKDLVTNQIYTEDDIAYMMGTSYDAMREHAILNLMQKAERKDTILSFPKCTLTYDASSNKSDMSKLYDALLPVHEALKDFTKEQMENLKACLNNVLPKLENSDTKALFDQIEALASHRKETLKTALNSNASSVSDEKIQELFSKIQKLDSEQKALLKDAVNEKMPEITDSKVKAARHAIVAAKSVIDAIILNTYEQSSVVNWTEVFTTGSKDSTA